MIIQKLHDDFFRTGRWRPAGWMILCLCLWSGCTSMSQIKKKTTTIVHHFSIDNDGLKKKIQLEFSDNTQLFKKDEFPRTFRESFITTLDSENSNFWIADSNPDASQSEIPRLPSGSIDNFTCAVQGRFLGLNALIVTGITDITTDERAEGFLWFRDTHYYVQIQTSAAVYDMESAAKILDEEFVHEIEIDDSDVDYIQARKWNGIPDILEGVEYAAAVLAEKVRDVLLHQPWIGYVVSVQDERLIISSGRQAGLKPHSRLDVFNLGEIKNGVNGQKFITVGSKVGEIEIETVDSDQSEARIISGGDFKPNFSVKLQK